jgi:RNA 2',3'-cyclic 3'-phosphodiesterase
VRCFVACWPDAATRARLDHATGDAHQRYPRARRIRADNLHLTLAFIGELELTKAREAVGALRDLVSEPFDWRIDHVGHFERARVLWASGEPAPGLMELAERVRQRLQTLQIRFDTKPFAAHVTLLRDVPSLRSHSSSEVLYPIEPFAWPIRDALMVVSERDPQGAVVYRPLLTV